MYYLTLTKLSVSLAVVKVGNADQITLCQFHSHLPIRLLEILLLELIQAYKNQHSHIFLT